MTEITNIQVPPEGLKPIIEKTIEYVVRNGISFEAELRKRNASGGNKFGFLRSNHPFNLFYRSELNLKLNPEEIEKLRILRQKEEEKALEDEKVAQKQTTIRTLTLTEKIQQELKLYRIPKEKFIRAPKLNKYTVTVPKGIKPMLVDLIKLTAQFVARSGRKFLTNLTSKEKNNNEFEFLDPVHPFFPYFQKLVNAYCLCIVPPIDLMEKLKFDLSKENILLQAVGEAEYLRQEQDRKVQKEADEEEDRIQMQLIDWHRFVVLETLDFNEGEIYPPPGHTMQQINEILNTDSRTEIKITLAEDIPEDQEMDMNVEVEPEKNVGDINIEISDIDQREEYKNVESNLDGNEFVDLDDLATIPEIMSNEEKELRTKVEDVLKLRATNNSFVESPFTGDMIPLNEISDHIRIMLLNPQWKEQKELLIDKMRTTSFADNRDIAKNLDKFTIKREELNMVKAEPEQDLASKSSGWDGFQISRGSAKISSLIKEKNELKKKSYLKDKQEEIKEQNRIAQETRKLIPMEKNTEVRVIVKENVEKAEIHNGINIIIRLPNGESITHRTNPNVQVSTFKMELLEKLKNITIPKKSRLTTTSNQVMQDEFYISEYEVNNPLFLNY